MNGLKAKAVAVFIDKGERPAQEDCLLADQEKGIFAVADGFGGPNAGTLAATSACEAVKGFLFKEASDLDATLPFVLRSYFSLAGNVLFNALIHANRKLVGLNKNKDVHEKGGASVIAGFVDGDLLALANVGCCTAWLARGDQILELVVPRSLGRLRHPFGHESEDDILDVPLMALGITEDLEPEIMEYRLEPGDWLLLHSDGLPGEMRKSVLELRQQGGPPETSVQGVTELLQSIPYKDNTSSLLVIF